MNLHVKRHDHLGQHNADGRPGRARAVAAAMAIAVMAVGGAAPPAAVAATCAAWAVVPSPNPGPVNNQLLGVAAIATADVWAVGLSAGTSAGARTLIEHWDGSAWNTVSGAGSGAGMLYAVAGASANAVWAVGSPGLLERWNGSSWILAAPAVPNGGGGLSFAGVTALAANDVWAVGWYSRGSTKTLIEHWNGSTWTVVPSPNAGVNVPSRLYAVSAASATEAWAVGFSAKSGVEQPLIEHWNGTTWSIVPGAQTGTQGYLLGVSTASASAAFAVGRSSVPLIERWSGSWTLAANPLTSGSLSGVAAFSPTDAWVTGNDGTSPIVEHWNGTAWSVVTTPTVTAGANGLAGIDPLSATDMWAVGDRGLPGGTIGTLVEHFTSRSC